MSETQTHGHPRKGKPGRRHKGDRRATTVRFPTELYEALKQDAAARGYKEREFSDYVVDRCRDYLEAQHRDGDGRFAKSA